MHIVTGGLGFIGSNIVKKLAKRNYSEKILIIDRISSRNKYINLPSLRNIELVDPHDYNIIEKKIKSCKKNSVIYHMGACSDTTEKNGEFLYENNYKFSKNLIDLVEHKNLTLINASSASVYGLNKISKEEEKYETPINHYAFTKLLVDQYIEQKLLKNPKLKIISLRFFNVYGFGEFSKGRMASLPYKFFYKLKHSEPLLLFGKSNGYDAGEHSRDFIYVEDILNVIEKSINRKINGIYNLGTGKNRSFNDLALSCINAYDKLHGIDQKINLDQALSKGLIEYVDFPEDLKGKYQNFTKANMEKLLSNSIAPPATSIEEGIFDYYSKMQTFWFNNI
mgnify:CR=1 FL=1